MEANKNGKQCIQESVVRKEIESNEIKDDKPIKTKKIIIGGVIAIGLIFAVYIALILGTTWPISEFSMSKAGVFGDSFGFLTSLFSGLAFGGIILALFLQRSDLGLQQRQLIISNRELRLQREELSLQRKELELTRLELNQSNEIGSEHLKYLEAREQKEDIMRMILMVDEKLEYLKNQHLPYDFVPGHTGLAHISFNYCFGETRKPRVFEKCQSEEQVGEIPQVIHTFIQTVSELYAYLHEYRQKFKEITYAPHVFQYYIRKYRDIVQRLNEKGYADERLVNNFGRPFDSGFDAGFGTDEEK